MEFQPAEPPPSFRGAASLPLFGGAAAGDDEPLIKVAPQPRAPLAVRRTPDRPRLRTVARAATAPAPASQLDLIDDPPAPARPSPVSHQSSSPPVPLQASGAGARLLAVTVDHAILLAIDAVVLYLTLRIAALPMHEWQAVPLLPMAMFLGLIKLAYFTAFTCVGGQTIGKMAVGIRVVGDNDRGLDPPRALQRALAGAVSYLTLGVAFLPALFAADHRALHDRLAHTRVVVVPGA